MSYIPTIIASWEDLTRADNIPVIMGWHDTDTDEGKSMGIIYKAVNSNDYITLKGVKMTIFKSDLSGENNAIREALREMGVEYTIDN